MFSTGLLRYEISGERVEPCFIDSRYAPLVRSIVIHYEAFAGKRYRELQEALAESRDASVHDRRVVEGLHRVIEESVELEAPGSIPARCVRGEVFELATARADAGAEAVWREAAARLSVPAEEIRELLYADLAPERRVAFKRPIPGVRELIARYNFRLLQGFFLHAELVRVETSESLRAVYRFAKLHGLLVEARPATDDGDPCLEISGPLSLFRRTRKYARSLADFLPVCATGTRFRIEAAVVLRDRRLRLEVTQADGVLSPHALPRAFDSRLEERFYRDFLRLRSSWAISRESELVILEDTVFLPDFSFRHRSRPELRVDLEIVGFWTRDYLVRKRALFDALREREPERALIVCADERRFCDRDLESFPGIRFRGRVPADEVLRLLEEIAGQGEG